MEHESNRLKMVSGTNSLTGSVISAAALKVLPEFLKGIKLFGINLQDCKTIIYCLLIVVVINFRTQGIMGERELNLRWVSDLARKKKSKEKEAAK